MRILAIIMAATLSVTLPQASEAQDLDRAERALEAGDYAAALQELRPLAEQGHSYALSALGAMYAQGLGVPQNYDEAVRLFQSAAEQGDSMGPWLLGVMYQYGGSGVRQNYELAYMWYDLAAAQDDDFRHLADDEGDYADDRREFRQLARGLKDELADQMTPEQLARAQQLSSECFARNYQGCAQ